MLDCSFLAIRYTSKYCFWSLGGSPNIVGPSIIRSITYLVLSSLPNWTILIEDVIADVTARWDIRRASDIGDYLLSKLLPGDGKAKPLPPFNSVVPADTSQPDAPPTKTSKQAADIGTDVEAECLFVNWA